MVPPHPYPPVVSIVEEPLMVGPARTPSNETAVTLYRYGWIAWFWRVLVLFALAGSAFLLFAAVRFGDWTFLAMALPIALPAILLPWMLAVRIERVDRDRILVTNLFFVRRRIPLSDLGRPRRRDKAQAMFRMIPAPRAWIPVRGRLPVYVDLFADIPDPNAFDAVFKIPRTPSGPRGSKRRAR